MSDLNFSKWDLAEGKEQKVRRVSADELTSIILQEIGEDHLGMWNSKVPDPELSDRQASELTFSADPLTDVQRYKLDQKYQNDHARELDSEEEELFVSNIESNSFAAQATAGPDDEEFEGGGVTIVDSPYEAGMFEMDGEPEDRSLDGLEGPFDFSGRELYYDNREEGGQYYDRGTDMYLSDDEATSAVMGAPEIDVSSFSLEEQDEAVAADAADMVGIDDGGDDEAGSFYTGDDGDDMDLDMDEQMSRFLRGGGKRRELPKAAGKKTDLPSKFMAWKNSSENQNTDPRTKAMLAKKVLDSVGIKDQDAAIQNLAHWIDYEPSAMGDIFDQLKFDAYGGQMAEQNGMDAGRLPEPFWSHGFPQVNIKQIADAIADSMIPGGNKTDTLELVRIMRSELDGLETEIQGGN